MITELTTKEVYVLELESGARYSGSSFESAFKKLAQDSLGIEVMFAKDRRCPVRLFRQFEIDLSPLKLMRGIEEATKQALTAFRTGEGKSQGCISALKTERYLGVERTALMLLAAGDQVFEMAKEKCPKELVAMKEEYNKSLKVSFKVN